MSVRENIVFGMSMDTRKYGEVVDTCELKQDFDILPAGDHTEIGERVCIVITILTHLHSYTHYIFRASTYPVDRNSG